MTELYCQAGCGNLIEEGEAVAVMEKSLLHDNDLCVHMYGATLLMGHVARGGGAYSATVEIIPYDEALQRAEEGSILFSPLETKANKGPE